MKRSSKLRLSDNNHRLYTCNDEEAMEILYLQPYEMLNMIKHKKLNFSGVEVVQTDVLAERV